MGLLSGSTSRMAGLNRYQENDLISGGKVTSLNNTPAKQVLRKYGKLRTSGKVTANEVIAMSEKAALEREYANQTKRLAQEQIKYVQSKMDRLEEAQAYSQEMMNQEARYAQIMGKQSMAINRFDERTSINRARVSANNQVFLGSGGFAGFGIHPELVN
jgi:hypothetical protein